MACLNCGFELVETGKRCDVCGTDSIAETSVRDVSGDATVARAAPSRPGEAAFGIGDVFVGRYEIVSRIGRGGMGSVYRVRDRSDGCERALKVLHATADDEQAIVRFRREIEILSRIRHPGIVRISDWGVDGRRMYFAAELIEGEDLRLVLRKRGVFPPEDVATIGSTIAGALAAAHAQGIVHRDVKPHNVMVRPDGRLTLLDFGIARGAGIDMNTITVTGMMVGTPEYMSPEQFQGIRVDVRSDIYSLGVVLYELTAGVLPFRGDTPVALGIHHQTTPPPPIRPQRPSVPAWLERIILRCLEKQPGDRFDSAAELAAELARPRHGEKRVRDLPTGDQVIEDDSESEAWALTLVTREERKGWTCGMALKFEERFYRLDDARGDGTRWFYRFSYWPDEEILRKVVSYETDAYERTLRRKGLADRFKRWLH